MRNKIIGIIVLAILLCSMLPTSSAKVDDSVFEDILTTPLDEVENDTIGDITLPDVVLEHFRSKRQDISPAMVLTLIDKIDKEQTVVNSEYFGNNSLYYIYAEYLNNSSTSYMIHGENFTVREAYDKVPAVKSCIDSLENIATTVCKLSDREVVDYVYYSYPAVESIEKNLKGYDVNKLSYVIDHVNYDNSLLNSYPKNQLDIEGWNTYKDKVRKSLDEFALAIQNEGIYYDNNVRNNDSISPVVDLNKIYNIIMGNKEALDNLNQLQYDMQAEAISFLTVGSFAFSTGISLLVGHAKAKKAVENALEPLANNEVEAPPEGEVQRKDYESARPMGKLSDSGIRSEDAKQFLPENEIPKTEKKGVALSSEGFLSSRFRDYKQINFLDFDQQTRNTVLRELEVSNTLCLKYGDGSNRLALIMRAGDGQSVAVILEGEALTPNFGGRQIIFNEGTLLYVLSPNFETKGNEFPCYRFGGTRSFNSLSSVKLIGYNETVGGLFSKEEYNNCVVHFSDGNYSYSFDLNSKDDINITQFGLNNDSNIVVIAKIQVDKDLPSKLDYYYTIKSIPTWGTGVTIASGVLVALGTSCILLKYVPLANAIVAVIGAILVIVGGLLIAIGSTLYSCISTLIGVMSDIIAANNSLIKWYNYFNYDVV